MILQSLGEQRFVGVARLHRGPGDRVGKNPCRDLVVPQKSMPAHDDVVSLRKAELRVSVGKPESSFGRFGRVPFEVISGGDAVEVLLQQIGMYAGDFKRSDRRAYREEVSI